MDPILAAIQQVLDTEGDGWQVAAYVTIVGCHRINDGAVESQTFRYTAPEQPRWVTCGLLDEACDINEDVDD